MNIGPHVFPTQKYRLVRGAFPTGVVIDPEPASWEELALVHTGEYLAKMRTGALSAEDLAQLQLPWSDEMVTGFRVMVGGTITAARIACGFGGLPQCGSAPVPCANPTPIVCHIGGGLHHAFPNHGEGFCPFNDVAVAVRVLQSHHVQRLAIIDLDVHHGNGTAFIFNPRGDVAAERLEGDRDARVFTFSMHQQHNYPMWKPHGSLDIGLPDGAADDHFLRELDRALPIVMASSPECVFYLAGADPYEADQLGGLRLTREGLRRRDRMVIDAIRRANVPLVITLAGGYARDLEDTVAIHIQTIEEAHAALIATM